MQFSTGTSAPTTPPADPNLPAQFYNSTSKFTYNWDLGGQVWRVIPKVWRALVTQVGTANPTSFVTENTLVTGLDWWRIGVGVYFAMPNPSTAFTDNRTGVTVGPISNLFSNTSGSIQKGLQSGTFIIQTDNPDGVATDGLLDNTEFAISVYP